MDILRLPARIFWTCVRMVALGVIVAWAMCRKVWLSLKPLFQSIVDIYETINWEAITLVSVLRAVVVLAMLVVMFYWELARTMVTTCFSLVPYGHTMLRYLKTQMREIDAEHHILYRPLHCLMERPNRRNECSRNVGSGNEERVHEGRDSGPNQDGARPESGAVGRQNSASGNQNGASGNQNSASGGNQNGASGNQNSSSGNQNSPAGNQNRAAGGNQSGAGGGTNRGAAGRENEPAGQNGAQRDPGREEDRQIEVPAPVEVQAPAEPDNPEMMDGHGSGETQGEGQTARQGEGQAAGQREGQIAEQGQGQPAGKGQRQVTDQAQQATVKGQAARQGQAT